MDFLSIVTQTTSAFPSQAGARERTVFSVTNQPPYDLAGPGNFGPGEEIRSLLYGLTHNYTGYPLIKEARGVGALRKTRKKIQGGGGIPAGLAGDPD